MMLLAEKEVGPRRRCPAAERLGKAVTVHVLKSFVDFAEEQKSQNVAFHLFNITKK